MSNDREREVLSTTRKLLDQEPLNAAGETPTQHAHRWATELAISMARKLYPEVQQFEPLPDLLGVITQIDNMVTGLQRKRTAEQNAIELDALRARCEAAEALLRGAEQFVVSYANRNPLWTDNFNGCTQDPNGAHALRSRIDAHLKGAGRE